MDLTEGDNYIQFQSFLPSLGDFLEGFQGFSKDPVLLLLHLELG